MTSSVCDRAISGDVSVSCDRDIQIRGFPTKGQQFRHNLIVSQKLRALTSKKQPLYRAAQGNVQIVDYSLIYCSIDFPIQSDPLWNSGFIHCLGVCTTARRQFLFIKWFYQKRWNSGFTVRRRTPQMGYKKAL